MSTISERKKDGKVIAFKFLACLGRDANGKRIWKGTTWRPPEGLSYTKARKLAEAEAYRWEQELRSKGATLPQGEYTTAISKTEEGKSLEEISKKIGCARSQRAESPHLSMPRGTGF